MSALEKELRTYDAKKAELLRSAGGKFVLIKGEELIGLYDTIEEALSAGAERYGLDAFLVREVRSEEEKVSIPALTLGILNADA